MFASAGSIMMRRMARFGSGSRDGGVLLSTSIHVGVEAVPLAVLCRCPFPSPTQMTFELPLATAMALMSNQGLLSPRIELHVGVGADAVVVRHRLPPPASRTFALFGSITTGAMKSLWEFVPNGSPLVMSNPLFASPPFVERKISMYWYSP